jgi:hypothetical protein
VFFVCVLSQQSLGGSASGIEARLS